MMEERTHGLDYRPEIDGLWAVVVMPVVLFHLGFDWFFAAGAGRRRVVTLEMPPGLNEMPNLTHSRETLCIPAFYPVFGERDACPSNQRSS
jgi:hypothetical protein